MFPFFQEFETRHGWIITKDLISNGEAEGTYGPRATPFDADTLSKGVRFRLRDDDGEVYYEGRFVGDADSEDGFAPLDDFGGPGAGCTSIQYWKPGAGGGWKTL
jgi:hypothetical protein